MTSTFLLDLLIPVMKHNLEQKVKEYSDFFFTGKRKTEHAPAASQCKVMIQQLH